MKVGDKIEVSNPKHAWFGSTGVVDSLVLFEGESTNRVRVNKLSQHSLPHAIGIFEIEDLKSLETV